MKELIVRHITSPGFQRRWTNIYWPFLKTFLATPYNKTLIYWSEKWYENQMIHSEETLTVDDVDSASYSVNQRVVLTQEDAFDVVRQYLVDHEDQDFGMCVTHTVKNIYRFAAKALFSGITDFSEHDIYLDRTTRHNGVDAGMNSSATLDRIIEKGVAIHGIVPDPVEESDLNATREDYPDDQLTPWRIKLLKQRGFMDARRDFEKVWAFMTEDYAKRGVRPFQFSIIAMRGWWTSDVPSATGTIYGGHSVMGLTIPFMYGNKRAFFAIDSSYRSGLAWQVAPGVRIVTEDCWYGLGKYVRPVEFIDSIEQALGGNIVTPTPVPPSIPQRPGKPEVLSISAVFGQENEHVAKIQKALVHFGYDLPAITKAGAPWGYYGTETAAAVKRWQVDLAPVFNSLDGRWSADSLAALEGKHFGDLSVKVMNMQINQ